MHIAADHFWKDKPRKLSKQVR